MNDWVKKDLKHLWHPYSQAKDHELIPPIIIEKGEGVKLFDQEGKWYYDTISSWWCNIHGHGHPKIREAINSQLESLEHVLFAGFSHKPAVKLGERLVDITPDNLKRVFYSDNGSTAVESALKISFQYWQNVGKPEKDKFVGFDLGYHGDTVGAMSVAGDTTFTGVFKKLLFENFKVPTPYCYRCPMGKDHSSCSIDCIAPLQEILGKHNSRIAGIILEPLMLGAAGIITYPKEYLQKAASLAAEYGVHFIADEVATGFGKTGSMFACEKAGVKPDFMCLSKGITSGTVPFAATLTTEEIYNAFYDDYDKFKTLYHGHTYCANPIGCAAANASLDLFEEEGTLEKAKANIPMFHKGMEKFRDLKYTGDVRSLGLIGAVELVKDKDSKEGFEVSKRIGQMIYIKGLKENLILRPLGNVTYLIPPLSTPVEDLEAILDKTFKVINSLDF